MGILQPSDLLHEEGDLTFCPALVTLNEGKIMIPVNIFTDQHYKLKKGLHFANFSIMTPEQINLSNRLIQHRPCISYKTPKSRQPIMSHKTKQKSPKLPKTPQNPQIIGFQLQKTEETQTNTHHPRKGDNANYRTLILQKTRNLGQSS